MSMIPHRLADLPIAPYALIRRRAGWTVEGPGVVCSPAPTEEPARILAVMLAAAYESGRQSAGAPPNPAALVRGPRVVR